MVGRRNTNEVDSKKEFKEVKHITAYNYFLEYLFPDAILYGMSYNEFWEKDPQLFFSYRFSYIEKINIERKKQNYNAWLNGLYNSKAQQVVLHNAFAGKGEQPQSYFSSPIDWDAEPETKEIKETKEVSKKNNWARLKERSVK